MDPTSGTSNLSNLKPLPKNGDRHTLSPQTELRLEVPSHTSVSLTLLSGSAEIFGAEMAIFTSGSGPGIQADLSKSKQTYLIPGHAKFAVFTWHGCVLDVDVEFGKDLDIGYTSEETVANVAYVNTHAQLEAMRDEALMNATNPNVNSSVSGSYKNSIDSIDGPRVLVVGPADCGKTSLVKLLTSYAVKLGRTPMLVDLDTSQNMLSAPGAIAASPMTPDSISPLTNASSSSLFSTTTPLVLWNGSTELSSNPDLYKAQLDKIGQCIDERNNTINGTSTGTTSTATASNTEEESHIVDSRSSGIIVNGCGWIEDIGYTLMLHTVKALRINVILVMGHDRLYSMLNSHFNKMRDADVSMDGGGSGNGINDVIPKVIKLPRSGGVVSRDPTFRRVARSLCIKRYFYGESIRNPNAPVASSATGSGMLFQGAGSNVHGTGIQDTICPPSSTLVYQYTPTRLEIPFGDLTLYKLSSVSLSASMLPVSAKQATDPVQLTPVEITSTLKHGVLAVCHPNAAEQFRESGEARDLYLAGISGLVTVEKVDVDREIISLLSPGGSLPSSILLVGDITWME